MADKLEFSPNREVNMRSEQLQLLGRTLVGALVVVFAFTVVSTAQTYKQTNLVADVDDINGVPTNPVYDVAF